MSAAGTTFLRVTTLRLGVPEGAGILFDRAARRTLVLATVGSAAVAGLEVLALAAMVPLMQVLTGVSVSGQLSDFVSGLFGHPSQSRLAAYIGVSVLVIYLLKSLATVGFRWWLSGALTTTQVATATRLFDYYLRAPYALHLRRSTADILGTLNDAVGQVYTTVVPGLITATSDMLTVLAVTVTLVVVTPGPALAVVAYFLLASLVFQRWVRGRVLVAGATALASNRAVFQAAIEAIGTVKEVQVRNGEVYFLDRYRVARHSAAQASRRSAFYTDLPRFFMEIVFVVAVGLMTVLVFSQQSTATAVGMLALFAAAGFRILPTIVRIIASLNQVKAGSPAMGLVVADLHKALDLGSAPERHPEPLPFSRSLELREVHFRYPDAEDDVIDGVSLTVGYGQSVAFVGGSGAGKTTLVDLVLGLHNPTSGAILVDGVDIGHHMRAWRENIGMVPQTVWLVDASLRENIVFASDPATLDAAALHDAVSGAHLDDVIASMPGGLDGDAGDRGVRLSGGQRQRVGIARALYRRPRLLVLDEATSALDNETERQVTDAIAALRGRMTMLVVAHRLSTVRDCDVVVFLQDGRVAAMGSFDEVREANAAFARLVELGRLD